MDQNLLMKQRELNDRLNRYRNEYYNLNSPSVSDAVYDRLFEELQDLESATGVQMSNSPTNTVGYPAVSKLEKTNHSIPLLSLDKVKNAEDLCRFKQFVHFVSKKAMNIEGLSEGTLEKLIGRGWIHSYLDIYRLDQHMNEIIRMDGFGEKSWQRLWDAIQQSRSTTFERYVIAMDIPMVGNTASKVLCREFHGSLDEFRDAVYGGYDFRQLPDFGETLHNNIQEWFNKEENFCIWEELQMMMNIQKPAEADNQTINRDNPFSGKTIVVTGKVEPYTRDEMNSLIASLGAVAGSSVTRKTNYLVCGEKAGSKLSKARELGIPVLTPEEFFRMANVA